MVDFKKLWDRGLVYEIKILPYSPRIATPLSNFEAKSHYQDVQDPAVTVKLPLEDKDNTYLLIWTTTPWTLPANLAVAVNKDLTYVEVEDDQSKEHYIAHEALIDDLYKKRGKGATYQVIKKYTGNDLVGMHYTHIIPAFANQLPNNAFQVYAGDFVTADSGTVWFTLHRVW